MRRTALIVSCLVAGCGEDPGQVTVTIDGEDVRFEVAEGAAWSDGEVTDVFGLADGGRFASIEILIPASVPGSYDCMARPPSPPDGHITVHESGGPGVLEAGRLMGTCNIELDRIGAEGGRIRGSFTATLVRCASCATPDATLATGEFDTIRYRAAP